MRRARVQEWLLRYPFRPFRVHVADGTPYGIPHPDFAQLSPDGRELTVWYNSTRKALIDTFFITVLEETELSRHDHAQ